LSDPETPSRRATPALKLAAAPPAGEASAAPGLEAPLLPVLEALQDLAAERAALIEVLRQRLGDARTVALLAQGGTAGAIGPLIAQAARGAGEAVRRSLAEKPDDASGRLACLRAEFRFGRILLAQGLVAPRRLEAALESQKASGRRIGEELVAEGQISAREVAEALWLQHKLAAAGLALLLLPARETASPRLVHSTK